MLCTEEFLDLNGRELKDFCQELSALRAYWHTFDFSHAKGGAIENTLSADKEQIVYSTETYHRQCLSRLWKAAQLAIEHKGFLIVS